MSKEVFVLSLYLFVRNNPMNITDGLGNISFADIWNWIQTFLEWQIQSAVTSAFASALDEAAVTYPECTIVPDAALNGIVATQIVSAMKGDAEASAMSLPSWVPGWVHWLSENGNVYYRKANCCDDNGDDSSMVYVTVEFSF